jgi:hypothetical protein
VHFCRITDVDVLRHGVHECLGAGEIVFGLDNLLAPLRLGRELVRDGFLLILPWKWILRVVIIRPSRALIRGGLKLRDCSLWVRAGNGQGRFGIDLMLPAAVEAEAAESEY